MKLGKPGGVVSWLAPSYPAKVGGPGVAGNAPRQDLHLALNAGSRRRRLRRVRAISLDIKNEVLHTHTTPFTISSWTALHTLTLKQSSWQHVAAFAE